MLLRPLLASLLFSALTLVPAPVADDKSGAAAYSSGVTTKIFLKTQTDARLLLFVVGTVGQPFAVRTSSP